MFFNTKNCFFKIYTKSDNKENFKNTRKIPDFLSSKPNNYSVCEHKSSETPKQKLGKFSSKSNKISKV